MAGGINKCIIVGNLGQDPEVRYLPNGDAVCNITVATSESWKDKNTGQKQEKTEWHKIVLFRRLGEIAGEYLKKGSKVYVEGKLSTRKWQDQSGQDRYTTEIVASEMQMLDSRGQSPQGRQQGQPQPQAQRQQGQTNSQGFMSNGRAVGTNAQKGGGQGPQQQQRPTKQAQPQAAQQGQQFTPDLDEGWDSDIPFAPIGLQYPRLLTCI